VGGLRVVLLDDHVVEQTAVGAEHPRDRLSEQREVVLLNPLVVKPAWKLDRQLAQVVLVLQGVGLQRLKPGREALAAHVVPDDVETFVPGAVGGLIHSRPSSVSRAGGLARVIGDEDEKRWC
jgi:hypothetical protein